jgi:hypothetical protein
MDPVRQEVLETAHPALDRWKVASVPKRWVPEEQQTHTHTYGNSKQASLIQAFRRIVQLEKMGVHMQDATKQSLLESFISTEDAARLPVRGSPRRNKATTTTNTPNTQTTWSIKDYLGWNPLEGPPPASLPDPFDATQTLSKHCVLALSLELVLLLELSGLVQNDDAEEGMGMYDDDDKDKEDNEMEEEDKKPSPSTTPKINTTKQRKALSKEGRVIHILQYLPSLRPYLGPTQVNTQTYHDQVLLASSVVRALSRGGELRMPALLVPHEYFFLREHVPVHLLNRDVLLLARSVDALRVLGSHDENPIIRASMSFLMGVQGFNGSWPLSLGGDGNGGGGGGNNGGTSSLSSSSTSSSSSAMSLLVSPTLSAVRALLVREFVGYGPLPLEVVDVLLAMQKEDADAPVESLPAAQDEVVFLLPDGRLDNRLKDVTRLVTKMKKRQLKREKERQKEEQQQQQEGGGGGGGGGKNSRSNSVDSASRTFPSEPPSLAKAGTATSSSSISSLPTLVPPPPSTTTTATPTDTAVATRIQKQGKEIEKAKEENNWSLVLKGLQALDRENMTLQLLSTTGIGKVVGKLKKVEGEGAAAVVELSKKLVKKWKGLVPVA